MKRFAPVLTSGFCLVLVGSVFAAGRMVHSGAHHTTYGSTHGITVHGFSIDHNRMLYHYASTRPEVPGAVVMNHAQAIRWNLGSAGTINRDFGELHANDGEVTGLLGQIRDHHARAYTTIGALEQAGLNDSVDSATIIKHTRELNDHLRGAAKAQGELHEHFGGGELVDF